MKRIKRYQAIMRFAKGLLFIAVPSNCNPVSQFAMTIDSSKLGDMTFERMENAFAYYNTSEELGWHIHYYTAD